MKNHHSNRNRMLDNRPYEEKLHSKKAKHFASDEFKMYQDINYGHSTQTMNSVTEFNAGIATE